MEAPGEIITSKLRDTFEAANKGLHVGKWISQDLVSLCVRDF